MWSIQQGDDVICDGWVPTSPEVSCMWSCYRVKVDDDEFDVMDWNAVGFIFLLGASAGVFLG